MSDNVERFLAALPLGVRMRVRHSIRPDMAILEWRRGRNAVQVCVGTTTPFIGWHRIENDRYVEPSRYTSIDRLLGAA